jgi:hypothetical protein
VAFRLLVIVANGIASVRFGFKKFEGKNKENR